MGRRVLWLVASWAIACSPGPELSILIKAAPGEPLEGTDELVLSTSFAVAARGHEAEAERSRRVTVAGPVAPATPVLLAATVGNPGEYAVHVDLWQGEQVWSATRCLEVDGVERLTVELVHGSGVDADEDGWPAEGPAECAAFDHGLADCDDGARLVHPFAFDLCNSGVDEDCVGGDARCSDLDGDGSGDDVDCDDDDPNIHPGAVEDCDPAVDSDCDGEPRCDADGDGSLPGPGEDCDDGDAAVHPGAPEQCEDQVDSDCDGFPSNGCLENDQDGDGVVAREAGGQDCGDCDPSVRPGAADPCGDGIDQDCDGADEHCAAGDADHDGAVAIAAGGTDCDDADPAAFPGAPEPCSSARDLDCDGRAGSCDGPDDDGDDWEAADDCDDGDPAIHPGATETCNDVDDDCDGVVDEPDNCISLESQQNCGACWQQCNGTCDGGECGCGNGPACDAGERCCGERCVAVTSDESNCGGCNVRCSSGEECIDGTCRCGDVPACAVFEECCGGACTDVSSDTSNCGGCGLDCGTDSQCSGGYCYCSGEDAPIDLMSDDRHCGTCWTQCDTRCQHHHACQECVGGECVAR